MNLESRNLACDDIGRQTLSYGERNDPKTLCAKVDKVTAADLHRVARKMIRGKPSFVAYGDVSELQPYSVIEESFQRVSAYLDSQTHV